MQYSKNGNSFFVFDSHSRGAKGRAAQNGTSCVIKFPCEGKLYALVKSVIPKFGPGILENQYTLTGILVNLQNLTTEQNLPTTTNNTVIANSNINCRTQTNEENDIILSTSILRTIDEPIPQVSTVIESDSNNIPLHNLKRRTAPPLQMNNEKRAEELSWFYLFPKGRNGLHESRDHYITPLDYCQARIMGEDPRFQRNDYLFYALSVMEFFRARQNVGVVLRMRQGNNRPEGLVENLHLNMRSLRGSNAYWQRACSDLLAMV